MTAFEASKRTDLSGDIDKLPHLEADHHCSYDIETLQNTEDF